MLDFEDGKHLWLLKILVKAAKMTIFSICSFCYLKSILAVPISIFIALNMIVAVNLLLLLFYFILFFS